MPLLCILFSPSDTSVLFEAGGVMPRHMEGITLTGGAGPVLSKPAVSASTELTTGLGYLRMNGWGVEGFALPNQDPHPKTGAASSAPTMERVRARGEFETNTSFVRGAPASTGLRTGPSTKLRTGPWT